MNDVNRGPEDEEEEIPESALDELSNGKGGDDDE
jgi:hypothetical protein